MNLLITQMWSEHRLSALLQLHLHFRLNTWLQWIGQRQLQRETTNIEVLRIAAPYIRDLTVYKYLQLFQIHLQNFSNRRGRNRGPLGSNVAMFWLQAYKDNGWQWVRTEDHHTQVSM